MTERGDLAEAYMQARTLVAQRPDSGDAHFTLSYVLRYAGLLEESMNECDIARAYDPTNPGLRSCSLAFAEVARFERGEQFLAIDQNSEWARSVRGVFLAYQGRVSDAAREAATLPDDEMWRMFVLTQQRAPHAEIDAAAEQAKRVTILPDGESVYWAAGIFSLCGRDRDALDLLRSAISKGYCSYPAIDRARPFDSIRNTPKFQQIRADAIACQQRFVQWRAANAP